MKAATRSTVRGGGKPLSAKAERRPTSEAQRRLGAIEGLRNFRELRVMQLMRRKSVKLLKAHDQRPPFVWIDPVGIVAHQNGFCEMCAIDACVDWRRSPSPHRSMSARSVR